MEASQPHGCSQAQMRAIPAPRFALRMAGIPLTVCLLSSRTSHDAVLPLDRARSLLSLNVSFVLGLRHRLRQRRRWWRRTDAVPKP